MRKFTYPHDPAEWPGQLTVHVHRMLLENIQAACDYVLEVAEQVADGRLPESPSPLRGERDDVGRVATRDEDARHDQPLPAAENSDGDFLL